MNDSAALIRDVRGGAVVELALVAPLLLAITCGSIEVANYFRSEHILVKGVRDGARYAARQGIANFTACDAAPTGTVQADTKTLVRTGQIAGTSDLIPNWSSATFSVTTKCSVGNGTTNYGGLYNGLASGARYVIVTASVPYQPIMKTFGFQGIGYSLNATQQAAVMGI